MDENVCSDTWSHRETVRIEQLSKSELILEFHNAMNGLTYSWKTIQQRMRYQTLSEDINVEWAGICILKHSWDSNEILACARQPKDIQSVVTSGKGQAFEPIYLRKFLVDLRLILVRAGFEEKEAIFLVTTNVDNLLPAESSEKLEKYSTRDSESVRYEKKSIIDETVPLLGGRSQAGLFTPDRRRKNWLPFFTVPGCLS